MPKTIKVGTHQAKTQLSELLRLVEKGNEIIILRGSKEVALLKGINSLSAARVPGQGKGECKIKESFFDPLPSDIEEFFGKI